MERTFGWRHFRVKSKRRTANKEWFVEMVATCDENTQFWVNAQNLKVLCTFPLYLVQPPLS